MSLRLGSGMGRYLAELRVMPTDCVFTLLVSTIPSRAFLND